MNGDGGTGAGAASARKRVRIAVGVLGAVLAIGLVWAWLALPGIVAARTLGLLGVVCDPVSIEILPDLSHASIARTECTFPAGPVASLTLSNGAEVALLDLQPTTIDVPMLAVNPRAIEMAGVATAVLVTGDTPDPLRRALGALAAAARRTDLPERTTVGEIDVGRGAYVVVARGLVIAHGPSTFDITLASIGPPAYHGRAIDWELAVNEIEIHATPESAIITGHFDVNASVFSFPIARTIAFRLTGSALDGDGATYDLWIEPSAELTWLREHGQALLEQIRAAGGVQQAIEQQREERATDRAARVHDLRERLDQQVEAARARETPPSTTP